MELKLNKEDLKTLIRGEMIFKSIPTSIGLVPIVITLKSTIEEKE